MPCPPRSVRPRRRARALVSSSLCAAVIACAAPAAASAEPPPAPVPPVYVLALPANVAFIAFLPVPGAPDLFDLDLRAEVVLPLGCGDKVAGLLRRDGPRLDGADAYDVVIERRTAGDCKKDATRVGARWAIRMRIPDGGAARELVVGPRTFQVARKGAAVTLDGQEPMGDLPGAPPTAAPATFVLGEVQSAQLAGTGRTPQGGALIATVDVTAKFPRCAQAPLGFLGRGDLASKFLLDRFTPVAIAPLDGSCKAAAPRRATLRTVVRLPAGAKETTISVGDTRLAVRPAPAAPTQAVKK